MFSHRHPKLDFRFQLIYQDTAPMGKDPSAFTGGT